jgi:hypothetical protein
MWMSKHACSKNARGPKDPGDGRYLASRYRQPRECDRLLACWGFWSIGTRRVTPSVLPTAHRRRAPQHPASACWSWSFHHRSSFTSHASRRPWLSGFGRQPKSGLPHAIHSLSTGAKKPRFERSASRRSHSSMVPHGSAHYLTLTNRADN